jgi:uncharacterized protein (TIGR03067 family)
MGLFAITLLWVENKETKMESAILACLAVSLLFSREDKVSLEEPKDYQEKLQGTWVAREANYEGIKLVGQPELFDVREIQVQCVRESLIIKGRTMGRDWMINAHYSLNTNERPVQMDIIAEAGNRIGAILRLRGGDLDVSYNNLEPEKRPMQFFTNDRGAFSIKLRRKP